MSEFNNEHYEMIAAVFLEWLEYEMALLHEQFVKETEHQDYMLAFEDIRNRFSNMLAEDNVKFDEVKFEKACQPRS